MIKLKTATAAALALGFATSAFSSQARAMPVGGLASTATQVEDGVQNAHWVCGPYRCWWRPNYYAYAPGYYYGPPRFYRHGYGYGYGPRPFYRFGYHRWGW